MILPFDPDIAVGPLRTTWHALFALVGMFAGSALAISLLRGVVDRAIERGYAVAVTGILGGLAGGRLLHVLDHWDFYSMEPLRVLAVWDGGASITGGVIGGVLAGMWMARRQGMPVGVVLDAGVIGLGLGMAIGRIGDIVNGEHHALACTELPWCVRYTHPRSPGQRELVHPAVAYELLWDLAIVATLLWLRSRARALGLDGRLVYVFLGLYGAGRFVLSFLRLDPPWLGGLQQAQVVALIFVALAAIALVFARRAPAYARDRDRQG